MKKLLLNSFIHSTLLLASIALLSACAIKKEDTLVPAGSVAIFDAASMLGPNSIPTSGCTTSTWVNLSNANLTGAFTCYGNSGFEGFEGTGKQVSPYRVTFNGVTTSVSTTINQQPASAPNVTWIIWVYPTNTTTLPTQSLMSIDDHLGSYNRALLINNGMFTVYNGTGSFSPIAATANTWQQIVVTFSETNITLYKNNIAYPMPGTPTLKSTTQTLNIGRSGAGNFDLFQGSIAWVGVYNRILNAKEIQDSCTGLVSRFPGAVCN